MIWFAFWRLAALERTGVAERESDWSRMSYVLPLLLVIVLMIGPGWPPWLDYRLIRGGWIRYSIGVGMVTAGLAFTVWARRVLGRNWSGRIAIKSGQQLVRAGPYRYIRHPIYTGGLLAILGSAAASGRVSGFLAFCLACAALLHKIRIEERWLMREFGDQYREYRGVSWMLVPYLL
jgi:protein-S-isoprenylcysteine O-methyltransferase Ste14